MKSSVKGLIVILVIVMSFVAVPAVFAGTEAYNNPGYQNDDPGKPEGYDPCTYEVEGCVTYLIPNYGAIRIDDQITVYGVPDHIGIQVGDYVKVTYWVSPDGKNVACSIPIWEVGGCE